MKYRYRMCGLSVASEIEIPGAIPLGGLLRELDVTVRLAPVPETVAEPLGQGPFWSYNAESFVLDLEDIGRFAALGGKELRMEPAPSVPPDDALPFLVGTVFGALIYQRGHMLLHASVVTRAGKAYAFCGPSGAGKSTLAAALCAVGCEMGGDDLCRIDLDGSPLVHPDGRMFKLEDGPITSLGWQATRGPRVRRRIEKYYVAPPAATESPVPLAGIYLLNWNEVQSPSLSRLNTVDACQEMLRQSYRRNIALSLIGGQQFAQWTAQLVGRIGVWRLSRPNDLGRLGESVALLEAHWEAGG